MKTIRRALSLLLALGLLLTGLPAAMAQSAQFRDVRADAWYKEAVEYVREQALMNGTAQDRFSPELPVTRAAVVTVLHRMAGAPAAGINRFTDVPQDSWYCEAVNWAASNHILNDYGNRKFMPGLTITREQLAAVFYNYAQYMKLPAAGGFDLARFRDCEAISGWAEAAAEYVCAAGLMNGAGEHFDPAADATRAEAAAVLMRLHRALQERAEQAARFTAPKGDPIQNYPYLD